MSFDVAKITLIGHVGADADMKYLQNGTAVTNFNVAVNSRRGGQNGEDPPASWYQVACFGKLAELADQMVRKGNRVFVEGRVEIDQWTGQDGAMRTTVKVTANELVMLTPKDENTEAASPPRQKWSPDPNELPF